MKLTIEKIVQLVYSFAIAFGQFGAVEIGHLDALVREFAAGHDVSAINIHIALRGVPPTDGIPMEQAERYAVLGVLIRALVGEMNYAKEVGDAHVLHNTNDGNGIVVAESVSADGQTVALEEHPVPSDVEILEDAADAVNS